MSERQETILLIIGGIIFSASVIIWAVLFDGLALAFKWGLIN